MDKMHSLLRRQLKKIFGSADTIPENFQEMIGAINEAYFNFDEDRLMLERSIEISSDELVEANSQMRSIFQALPDMFLRIDAEGKILECKIPIDKSFSHIKANELVGKSIYTSFGPLAARRLEWAVRRAVKNKTVELAEYSVQNQTEQFREARVVWLGDEQLIVVVRDITERKLVEDRLLESRRTLQTLMSNLPGMAYRCRNDHDWTMEFVSEGSINLTGYQPDELINNSKISYSQLIHPDECEKVWDTIQTAMKERKPFQLTYRIKTADGEQKWVWEQGQGIFTPKGELTAIEGFISDTTEKVQMQEIILREKKLSENLINSSIDGIHAFDSQYRYIIWNPAMERISGKKKEEVLGRCAFDVFPFLKETGTDKYFNDALAGKTIVTKERPYTIPETGKKGFFEGHYAPLYDKQSNIIGGLAIIHDITERKLAGESLHEIEEIYRAVIETTDTGFAAIDEQGLILNANLNYARLADYSAINQIIGRNVTEWTAPYDLERNRVEVGNCFKKGSVRNLEVDYQRKDGTIISVEINANTVQTKNGKIVVALCRDITERKAAENQVPAAVAAKSARCR